jgi:hypothetical protein
MRVVIKISILVCAVTIIMCHVFYKGKGDMKKARILSYGFNKMGDSEGLQPGIHAEYDAIRKLLPLRRKKRLVSINILVIRVSGKNKLQSSKPCVNCINTMKTLPPKLGYKIEDIYYSSDNGEIIKSSIKNLENEEPHYSRFYRQNKTRG